MRRENAPIANPLWICGSLLALLLAGVPAAAAPPPDVVAEIENRGTKMVFYPVVEYERIILTVTGPCNFEERQIIQQGDVGIFYLSEETIDAVYSAQLVAIPEIDGNIIELLQQARKDDEYSEVNALCREGELPGPPITQAISFTVYQGEITYDPYKEEDRGSAGEGSSAFGGAGTKGVPLKDFVINDDLIVDGSACIGFDCVNGESFGFDTIRVKENNLRIKFDDTSVAASFPRNDWQLTANDSANGGASKFSIDDISGNRTPFTVEANARSHSLYVDDGGRIGNRTSTPSTEIHTIDGDTPTLRLQQDGSSGFAPQTWDVAGNETNFFIRDVTNGSTLPFRIRPAAPTSSIFIDVNGDVGLGTSSPGGSLHVENTSGDDTDDFVVTEDGYVGIGTTAPGTNVVQVVGSTGADQTLLRLTNDAGASLVLEDTTNSTWEIKGKAGLQFSRSGSGVVEMTMGSTGNLTIEGNLVTGGGGTCDPGPCDRTFTDYALESIEDHAAYMWQNSHLWGVGPTPEGAPINLSKKTTGILHELEKAHIYIEQLHTRLTAKDDELATVQGELAGVHQRLQRLEVLLDASSD